MAVVADEPPFAGVIGEGDGAARTDGYVAAVAALNEGGGAPTVEEKDHLFTRGQGLSQRLSQRAAEDAAIARLQLLPQVHHLHLGQRPHNAGAFIARGQRLHPFPQLQ